MMQASSSMLLALIVLILRKDFMEASNPAEMSRFLTNLTQSGYDKRLRPTTDVTIVRVQIGIVAMGPISLLTTTMETEIFLRVYWTDRRLAFDNKTELNYNGDPSDLFWTPDVYCFNSIKTKRQRALTRNVRTKIGPNGDIYVSLRLNIKFSCKMDFRLYPMDTQECSMNFESYSYPYSEVRLIWLQNDPIKYDRKVQLSGYNITSFKSVARNLTYGVTKEVFGFLQAVFTISRLFPFYLYHVYVPSIFLVCLSWSTFWIPQESVPARVSLIVTNFLTSMLIFTQAGQSKPQVSYHTALELYTAMNAIFIMAVMLEYIFVLKIPNKGKKKGAGIKKDTFEPKHHAVNNGFHFYEDNKEMAFTHGSQFCHCKADDIVRQRKALEADEANSHEAENRSELHFIDSYARICFPLSYTIFLILYFTYYMLLA